MLFNRYVALALTLVAGATSIIATPLRQSEGLELATRSEFEQHESRDISEGMDKLVARTRHSSPEPDNPPPYTPRPKPDRPPPYTPKPPLPPIPEEGRRYRRALVEDVVKELVARNRHSSPEPDNPPPYTPRPKPDRPPPYTPKPPLPPIPEEGRHYRRALVEDLVNEIAARTHPDSPPPYTPRPKPDRPPPYTPKPPMPPIPEESRHRRREFIEALVNEIVARTHPDSPPPYTPRPKPDRPPPYTPKPPMPPIPEEERRHRREFVEAW